MKFLNKMLLAVAVFAGSVGMAHASPLTGDIYFDGKGNYTLNGNTGTFVGGNATVSMADGSFASYTTGKFFGFTTDSNGHLSGPTKLFTLGSKADNDLITFFLTSITSVIGGFQGTGYFTCQSSAVCDETGGSFSLSNFGTMRFNSNDIALAPEPSSLLLMGTGLMSAAGLALRRRRRLA